LVITRYFGGTLLGTGGLVRAYSDAAKAVLAILPRVEKIDRRELSVTLPYAAYDPVRRLIAAHAGSILAETFAADVSLHISLPLAEIVGFAMELKELTAGQIKISDSL
jgi:putative IMPACT (imprinted ancient) family translation regulator